MHEMFCYQCQQTAGNIACTNVGVCGKKKDTSNLQDGVIGRAAALAAAAGDNATPEIKKLIIDCLFLTVTNVSFDNEAIAEWSARLDRARSKYAPVSEMDMQAFWSGNEDLRSLKSLILFGIKGMAAYAHHAAALGFTDDYVNSFFVKALAALMEDKSGEELFELVLETGNVNLRCMELLDRANTRTYGTPEPTKVTTNIEEGPFIVVTGHDLRDLYLLLEQTEGRGVNIYTHGEMLPCHAYPRLRAFPHLKGHFGTAWQNQQKEFDAIPAPILFTTNCIMPVRESYGDRVFTTSLVGYPGMEHIGDAKDFTPVIARALELGGYPGGRKMTGINGGDTLTTGFGHGAVLSVADKVIDAVKAGDISRFFLVGGCDGAARGRNYYTEFVKQTPEDSIILTLACGKFRFNDLDLGKIGGLPRIMDMGQCNDAYSAIRVATALADAFGCGVNDLPLTLVLSWYEQKAVCILLSLLALGIRNIYIGPSIPAFISYNVLDVLVEKFGLRPITTPERDLEEILGGNAEEVA